MLSTLGAVPLLEGALILFPAAPAAAGSLRADRLVPWQSLALTPPARVPHHTATLHSAPTRVQRLVVAGHGKHPQPEPKESNTMEGVPSRSVYGAEHTVTMPRVGGQ